MNSYRIDTFLMENGEWKAVAYKCGNYIAERKSAKGEGMAIMLVSVAIATSLVKVRIA